MERLKIDKGITLVALTVTIIVLLILGGVTVVGLKGDNGILNSAGYAKLLSELSGYKEEVDLFKANKEAENKKFNGESLTAGKDTINYNTKKQEETGNIKTIITDISDKYFSNLEIIKGELLLKTKDKQLIKAAKQVGIEINPYDITDEGELLSSEGNLLLLDNEGTLTLPDSVKKIGYGAFSGLEGLRKIIIPASVTEIEGYAFSNNKALETVVIQGNLTSIGEYAFYETNNLKKINLPDSISNIGIRAFSGTGLAEVTIPKNLKELSYECFANSKLSKVTIQEGVTNIDYQTFYGIQIDKINIPKSVIYIDNNAFGSCNNLSEIDVSKSLNFVYESGMLMNKEKSEIKFISKKVLISSSVFKIPEGLFSFDTNITQYSNITKIIIPSTLTSINVRLLPRNISAIEIASGNNSFIVEDNLLYTKNDYELICCYSKEKNINIKEGIKKLGVASFNCATNVEYVTLPDSLVAICDRTFEYATTLKNVSIGKNVNDISPLFKRSNYSGTVSVDSQNPKYIVENNILYEKENGKKKTLVRVLNKISDTIDIDREVKKIGIYAFWAQPELTEISIPDGVEKIDFSFSSCLNLKKVEIPKSVLEIDSNCFGESDNNLEEIIVHNKESAISGAPWGAAKGMKVVKWEN